MQPHPYRSPAGRATPSLRPLGLRGPVRGALTFGGVSLVTLSVGTVAPGPEAFALALLGGVSLVLSGWYLFLAVRLRRQLDRLFAFLGEDVRLAEGGLALVSADGRRRVRRVGGRMRFEERDRHTGELRTRPEVAPAVATLWEGAGASRWAL